MDFKRIIIALWRLFICSYILGKYRVLVAEIHHGDILYFSFLRKQQKASFHTVHRVVREKLNFGLRVCRIFSCVFFLDFSSVFLVGLDVGGVAVGSSFALLD